MPSFLRSLILLVLLGTAHFARAQSTLTYDFQTAGQFAGNFRTLTAIGGGTAVQTDLSGVGVFRQDSTSGNTAGSYLFDQSPGDSTFATESAFDVTGPVTVAFDARAVTSTSSFTVVFADASNLNTQNIAAIFNVNTGADQVRFFRDGTPATNSGIGTQVGSTVNPSLAEPGSTFTNLSFRLTVSGTTPTVAVTIGGNTYSSSFTAGDFNWGKTLIILRLNDASTSAGALDIDNLVITSPAAPGSPVSPNTAPTLPAQTNRSIDTLSTLVVNNPATDADLPAQTLTYALTAAPAGATISATGVISWTPTAAEISPTPYTFTTQVTDSGTPALSATNSFQVTVFAAPAYPFSQVLSFTDGFDFSGNFRTLSAIGGGTFGVANGALTLDANSGGGNASTVFVFDTTPGDATPTAQTALPTTEEIRVSFLARAKNASSTFAVSFADPRNVGNRITALFELEAGSDTVRFFRDGSVTATTSTTGTPVGSDAVVATGAEPGSGVFVAVKAVLTVAGTTPTIAVTVGDAAPVTSAFAAGDIDWNPTLVLLRLGDPSTSKNTELEIDQLVIAGGAPIAVPAPVLPPAPGADGNLLTVNPSFESGSLNNFSGSYSFTGWTGTNALFASHAINSGSVAAGTTTHGTKKLLQSWGGTLTTALTARPPATPGTTYELRYDQRSLVRNYPTEKLGTLRFIEFFDPAGVRIKQVWGTTNDYKVQYVGKDVWETFTLRAVAPLGTAYVGVRVEAPAGRFQDASNDFTQDRHVEFDNFRLFVIPESIDRLTHRRAPRLIERGKIATLKINHAAVTARHLRVTLVDAAGLERATSTVAAPAGRFRATPVNVAIPTGLSDGTYAWRIELRPTSGSPAVATLNIPGVILDETVAAPPLANNEFPPNDPHILYMGRIEELANGQRWLHWFASEMRVRFTGSSITLRGTINDNSGAPDTASVLAVIDENFAAPITVALDTLNFTKTIASGLGAGTHTLRLFKNTESNNRIRIDGLRVAEGGGLLRPEPLPARKIEVFGDSVTNGGTASPVFFGYAPMLGRELDADMHVIAKGGTGVAASFSGQDILVNYWNNLSFPNVFNSNAAGSMEWQGFGTWVPDAVVIGIGHNDQFNGGLTTFNARYTEFKGYLRNVYPDAPIVTANTLISANLGQFQNATDPLTSVDPEHIFAFQPNTWSDSGTGHPPTAAHAAQIYGDERRYSLADLLEDRLGTGLNAALTAYEQWAVQEFTSAEIAAGWHAPAVSSAGDGTSNLLRFSLGLPTFGPVSGDSIQTLALDSQVRLTLTFFRASAEAQYIVELSDDLVSWTSAAVNPGTVGAFVTFTDTTVPPPSGRRFARLRISLF